MDCLQKILYTRSNGTIIYKTKYNEYWQENIKLFKASDFIAELTMHIPPKHKHLGNLLKQPEVVLHGTTGFIPAEQRVRPPKTGASKSLGIMPHPKRNLIMPLILASASTRLWRLYHLKLQGEAGHGSSNRFMRWTLGVCKVNSLVVLANAKTTLYMSEIWP